MIGNTLYCQSRKLDFRLWALDFGLWTLNFEFKEDLVLFENISLSIMPILNAKPRHSMANC